MTDPDAGTATDPGPAVARTVRWLPIVVFLLAAVAMMPRALLGQRAYTPIDVTARSSPMRDQPTRPTIVNPVQNDVPEGQAVLAGFWSDVRDGDLQLWSHHTGAGVPTGALPFNALTAPMSLPYLVAPRWYAPALRALVWFLVAQWGLYLLARRVGIGVAAATVAGVAFAFSGAELIMVFRIGAAAVGPWVLWALCGVVQRPSGRRVAALASVVAWSWLEGFPAATLFTVYVALAWGAWLLVVERPRSNAVAGHGPEDDTVATPARPTFVRWAAVRAALIGGALALSGVLVGFQVLPFAAVIRHSGLLETRRFDGTFALGPYALFGQLDNAVIGGLHGPWTGVVNSFEGIGLTGSIALVGAAAALVLAAFGRLQVAERVHRNVAFFGLAMVVMVVLCYSGGRLLDLVYALPGMRSNTVFRHRWFIPLFASLLLGVALDHVDHRLDLRRRRTQSDPSAERPTRAVRVGAALAMLAGAIVVGRAVPTFVEGLHTFGTSHRAAVAFAKSGAFALLAAAIATAPWWLVVGARRVVHRPPEKGPPSPWPSLTEQRSRIAATAVLAGLVWWQLAVPMRHWIPQAPVAPYFSTSLLTDDLRRLAGTAWRFTGTSEYTPYLNSAIVDGLLDLRTTPVLDQQYRAYLSSGEPSAFTADHLKTTFDPKTLDVRSPVLDELSVRYVVVGTDEGPLGEPDPQPVPDRWVPLAESGALGPVTAGGGVAGVGVALRTAVDDARCTGFVRIGLMADGREVGAARRPSWDLVGVPEGTDLTVAIAGGESVPLDTPVTVTVRVEDGSCPVEVGATVDAVAARLFYAPADGAWKVVATRQAWVYERRSAKPLVRIEADGRTAGTVRSFALVNNGVRADVQADRAATVVVAENDDPGWRATVDGRAVEITSVDGAILGVPVEPGHHIVRLRYVPEGWYPGLALTAIGLVALATCVLADRRRGRTSRTRNG